MNLAFTFLSAVVGSLCCAALNLTLVQYVLILVVTNMIWSMICHYKNWFTDI